MDNPTRERNFGIDGCAEGQLDTSLEYRHHGVGSFSQQPTHEFATADMTGAESSRCVFLCSGFAKIQATLAVLLERPLLVVASLAVFAILSSAGLAGVLVAAGNEAAKARDLAENGIGAQVAQSLKEALIVSTFGSELLSAVVVQTRTCAALEASWDDITRDIMQRVDPAVVQQLELDVAAVIWKTYPLLEGRLAEILYGRDLLREPSDRPGVIYSLEQMREAKQTLIMGPYTCQAGFKCAFTVMPIFLPAPSEDYDWGCGVQPYNCSDLCWDPVNKTKYWGQVSTMLNLDPFFSGEDLRLQLLASRGYVYRLWQEKTSDSNPYVLLANNTPSIASPVSRSVQIANLMWHLELAPSQGWVPEWRDPVLAASVVAAAAVSLLVLWLMVSREQHNRLLQAMLPHKVIRQLQSGAHSIAEHFDSVTVLFSDIVGYTTVASQLTPFQVVTLLNELFTVFDELTQRNGVYKVETIGDALMCVAGCPVPESPAAAAQRMARMALDMMTAVDQFRPSVPGVTRVQIRVGVHSGPVVAGVVGKKMPRYCLFGDTVNTSSRMESTSEPMRIQVSATTAALLRSLPGDEFTLEPRGPVSVKGKGIMDTFFLVSSASAAAAHERRDSLTIIVSKPVPSVTVLQHQQLQQQQQQQQPSQKGSRSSRLSRVAADLSHSAPLNLCCNTYPTTSVTARGGEMSGGGSGSPPRLSLLLTPPSPLSPLAQELNSPPLIKTVVSTSSVPVGCSSGRTTPSYGDLAGAPSYDKHPAATAKEVLRSRAAAQEGGDGGGGGDAEGNVATAAAVGLTVCSAPQQPALEEALEAAASGAVAVAVAGVDAGRKGTGAEASAPANGSNGVSASLLTITA